MAQQLFANNAFSSLASTITNVATSITLATGHGARFPAPTGGDHFLATLVGIDSNGNENAWEIIKVTTRSADVLTVVRGQEGSTALPWAAGSRIELRATSGTLGGLLQLTGGTITGPVTMTNGATTAFKVGLTGLVSVGGEAGSADSRFTITNGGAVGLEFSQTAIANQNRILSYNRLGAAFVPLSLAASEVRFNISGTDTLTANASGLTYTGTLTGGTGVVNLGSGQFVKDASGNFGLGVAPSANDYTGVMSFKWAGNCITPRAADNLALSSNAYHQSGGWKYDTTAAASNYIQSGGTHYWYTAPSGTAGNPISFTQAMVLDSAGNFGLGVTPSAWVGGRHFQFPYGAIGSSVNGYPELLNNAYESASNVWTYLHSGLGATRYSQNFGTHSWYTAPSGTAGNPISFTQAMDLGSSGDLTLHFGSFNFAARLGPAQINNYRSGDIELVQRTAGYGVSFFVGAGSYAGKFDASGNLMVGTTNTNFDVKGMKYRNDLGTLLNTAVDNTVFFAHRMGSAGVAVDFYCMNAGVGSISVTGTTTTYNTSSDARLKENIAAADNGSALIDQLQVRKFDWKADGSHQRYGFVAQELDAVFPEAVSKPADPEQMMGVDYSKLVPLIVQEVQSLRARLAVLEAA